MKRSILTMLIILSATFCFASFSWAGITIYVTPTGNDSNNGLTWADAKQTIQAGLNAVVSGDQVWVSSGSYLENITLKDGVSLYGGFAGIEDPTVFNLNDRDLKSNETVIDGNRAGSVVTSPQGVTQSARIDGFTITNGQAQNGGGINATSSSPTISNCIIIDNTATSSGGGLYLSNSNSRVLGNIIIGNRGAGVSTQGGRPEFINNVITSNSSAGVVLTYGFSKLLSNTIVGNGSYGIGTLQGTFSPTIVANNIIAFNRWGSYGSTSNITFRNNCFFGNSSGDFLGVTNPIGINGNISQDPQFAGYQYGDFRLNPGSPCVDTGSNEYVYTDYDIQGNPRIYPTGGIVDMGAYESDGTEWPTGPPVVIHISPDGNDNNDGLSWTTAKRTVQAGIETAFGSGGEVWVRQGRYPELILLRSFVYLYGGFFGNETARDQRDSKTFISILDGQRQGCVVTGSPGHRISTIDGFTITNGYVLNAGNTKGAGITLNQSSPVVSNNTIIQNEAVGGDGGGILLRNSSALIHNNIIQDNKSRNGAGIFILNSNFITIYNNLITENVSTENGSGIYMQGSIGGIYNNTISGNSSYGPGVYFQSSDVTFANNIVAFNSSGIVRSGENPNLRNNCVYGNFDFDYYGLPDPTGTDGNISQDPMFAGQEYGNFRLQPNSPCIDAGDNQYALGTHDLDGNPRILPVNGTVDIGAYESDGTLWPEGPNVIVRVSPDGNDENDGSLWASAKRSVQAGINAASNIGGEVWVKGGIYTETISLSPFVHVYGGFAGYETARNQRDWVANTTVLDAQQAGRVVSSTGVAFSTVNGFTITNGNGGVYLENSSAAIVNNTVIGNSTSDDGGGIFINRGAPKISNNIISSNSGNRGAGIYSNYSVPVIVNNTVVENTAATETGGIWLLGYDAVVKNNIVARNSSGIYIRFTNDVTNNCIFGNIAYDDYYGRNFPDEKGNISTDPKFVDPIHGNWRIQPDSPLIDAGENTNVFMDTDIAGAPRIQPLDGTVDIGAYESDGTVWSMGPYVIVHVSTLGDDQNDGLSWETAKRTVQAAIDEVSLIGGEVWVAEGVYHERIILKSNTHIYGGFTGDETERIQRDWVNNTTILDGQQKGSVVQSLTGGSLYTLDGFTITNGSAEFGGGVYIGVSSPRLINCRIINNTASQEGGGAYIWNAQPTVINCTVEANSAGKGGGFYIKRFSPNIVSNVIRGNTTTTSGAGIYIWDASPTVSGNTITGNQATTGGGGIYAISASPTIVNNVVAGNTAQTDGGGVYVYFSTPTIVNNTLVDNSAGAGGGIFVLGASSSAKAANNIIAFNSSGVTVNSGSIVLQHNNTFGSIGADYTGVANPTGTNGNISANPLFVDLVSGNFRLLEGSPSINAGINTAIPEGITTDKDGNPRICSDTVDMGAYELCQIVYDPVGISDARLSPDGSLVEITGAVISAVWDDFFYIQTDDRGAGIRIESTAHGFNENTRVSIQGVVDTNSDGERYISTDSVVPTGSGDAVPLGISNRSLGGGSFGNPPAGQLGVTGGSGLNNIGLLVRVWGTVTEIEPVTPPQKPSWLKIDDGSGNPIMCVILDSPEIDPQWIGRNVILIGISSCQFENGSLVSKLILKPTEAPVVY